MVDSANPTGEIPDIRKPDLQILLQDLAQSRRDVYEERRNKDRELASERERARWEIEKIRVESGEKIRGLERESEALIRAIGRLQGENDHLREEVAILRVTKNGHEEVKEAPKGSEHQVKAPGFQGIGSVGLQPRMVEIVGSAGSGPTGGKAPLVSPAEPTLGKSIPIDPSKL